MLARAAGSPTSASPRAPSFEELYAAIAALPRGITGEILEAGTIRAMGRPGSGHRFAASQIGDGLRAFDGRFRGRGWWLEVEAEIRLPIDRLVVPDLAGWRTDGGMPALVRETPIRVVPERVCEILSPTTGRDDRRLKLPLCAEQGVKWIWLVDPDLQLLEVYETRERMPVQVVVAKDHDQVALPPFDAEFDLAQWWEPPLEGTG